MRLLANDALYLAYFVALITAALLLALLPRMGLLSGRRREVGAGVTMEAVVSRGATSLRVIHGAFVIATALNIGVAQVVFPFMSKGITEYAFAMVLLETIAWGYLF